MPRQARIDAPGALHHIICRGIERRNIFKDNTDRNRFYAYTGHSVIMGKRKNPWQDTNSVLQLFGKSQYAARKKYRDFVEKGIGLGRNPEMTLRSIGGWGVLKSMRRMKIHIKGDERILGDSDFVEKVLSQASEQMERRYRLKAQGWTLTKIIERVAEIFGIEKDQVVVAGKQPDRVRARSVLSYWAIRDLGLTATEVGKYLGLSKSAVSRAATRGQKLIVDQFLSLED